MALKLYKDYCTGCGLCKAVSGVIFYEDEKGYNVPELQQTHETLCSKVCPASGNALKKYQDGTIWGAYKEALLGWSTDLGIRNGSSSGGVLTTLCVYLLEKGMVDGVIQTCRADSDLRRTKTNVSRTKDDVLRCMGSRYTTSSPLADLDAIAKEGGKYAFVGKPCDVSALRIYMEEVNPTLKEQIHYLFSFFCAGQPSIQANNKLVKALGGDKIEECADLQYRGNGWPGATTLVKRDGTMQSMDYETSWMTILGRDVRKCCRFCADGTGELADVSCGDAWYLDINGRPDFSERPGRNAIIIRTEKGRKLLEKIIGDHKLDVEVFNPDKDGLNKMQPYHYTRKASLLVYKRALRLCGRTFPLYDNKKLSQFSKGFSLKQKVLRFGGTVQRVLKGTI